MISYEEAIRSRKALITNRFNKYQKRASDGRWTSDGSVDRKKDNNGGNGNGRPKTATGDSEPPQDGSGSTSASSYPGREPKKRLFSQVKKGSALKPGDELTVKVSVDDRGKLKVDKSEAEGEVNWRHQELKRAQQTLEKVSEIAKQFEKPAAGVLGKSKEYIGKALTFLKERYGDKQTMVVLGTVAGTILAGAATGGAIAAGGAGAAATAAAWAPTAAAFAWGTAEARKVVSGIIGLGGKMMGEGMMAGEAWDYATAGFRKPTARTRNAAEPPDEMAGADKAPAFPQEGSADIDETVKNVVRFIRGFARATGTPVPPLDVIKIKNLVTKMQPPTENAFCATGKGGGVDPSCSKGDAKEGVVSKLIGSVKKAGRRLYQEVVAPKGGWSLSGLNQAEVALHKSGGNEKSLKALKASIAAYKAGGGKTQQRSWGPLQLIQKMAGSTSALAEDINPDKGAKELHRAAIEAHEEAASHLEKAGNSIAAARHRQAAMRHKNAEEIARNSLHIGVDMDRDEVIDFLVTNSEAWQFDGDREVLNCFSNEKLEALAEQALAANEGDCEGEAESGSNSEEEEEYEEEEEEAPRKKGPPMMTNQYGGGSMRKMSMKEWLRNAPSEAIAVWNHAVKIEARDRQFVINQLKEIAENCDNPRRQQAILNKLNTKGIKLDELQEMLELVRPQPVAPRVDPEALYIGAATPVDNMQTLTAEESDDILPLPTMADVG